MGSFTRFTRYVKDFWKVFIRGENDDLRRQTISMQEELARLRNRRMASDKEREAAAINQARSAVQRLRELHDSFLAAEVAASEFAAKMGEAAKSSMEAHAETRQQACKQFFMKQKELYEQEIKPDLEVETGPATMPELRSQSNGQEKTSGGPELKLADDKTCVATTGGSMSNETGERETCSRVVQGTVEIMGEEVRQPNMSVGERQTCSPVVQGVVEIVGEEVKQPNMSAGERQMCSCVVQGAVEIVGEEVRQPNTSADVASSNKITTVDKMGFTEEIPQDILAQMMQEVKKEVRREEKLQLDALARDRAMLEKEIEAREVGERASMFEGHQ